LTSEIQEAEIMFKRTVVALSIAALSFTTAAAQESATFTLRSGERITGQLVDMGGSGFVIRQNGQDRTIPTGDLSAIDFAGSSVSADDWNRVSSGQHLIVLRNGQTILGQLTDVGGTSPLRITVRADGNERDLTSSEVSRIVLARPTSTTSSAATTGSASGPTTITVDSRQQWTPTGITVRAGDTLRIRADGEIRISPDSNDRATASGIVNQRFDSRAPLPRVLAGALIGRIGNGQPFGIGTSADIKAPGTGQLFLGINESNVSDNDGSFQVTVERSGVPTRRR
jgi:hypothetical protein